MTLSALVRSLKIQHASPAAGFAAVIIAAAGLAGWWAELPLLSSWGAGLAAMKPVTSICLTALGVALMYPGKDSPLAFAVALPVLILPALHLSQVLFHRALLIDPY